MKQIVASAIFAAISAAALAEQKQDPITTVCGLGEPWMLPPSKPNDFGEQHIVRNAAQPVRVKVCNCSGKKQADSYVILNAYRAETSKPASVSRNAERKDSRQRSDPALPSPNTVTRLYAGSCVEAGGTDILLRNESKTDYANGTYSVAK